MTLDEYMKTANGLVQIGSGVGYFFFGTKEEYEEQIDNIAKWYHQKDIYWTKHCYGNKRSENRDIRKAKSLEFFNFRVREVREIRRSIMSGGTIVLIEGDELGEYWDIHEWNEKHGKGNTYKRLKDMEPREASKLAANIVLFAVNDYRRILIDEWGKINHEFVRGGSCGDGKYFNQEELENFFKSSWFKFLMPNVDANTMLKQYRERQFHYDIPEIPRVTYYDRRMGKNFKVTQGYNGHVKVLKDNTTLLHEEWRTERLDKKALRDIFKKYYKEYLKKEGYVA